MVRYTHQSCSEVLSNWSFSRCRPSGTPSNKPPRAVLCLPILTLALMLSFLIPLLVTLLTCLMVGTPRMTLSTGVFLAVSEMGMMSVFCRFVLLVYIHSMVYNKNYLLKTCTLTEWTCLGALLVARQSCVV